MPPFPSEILTPLTVFAPYLTAPTFANLLTLLWGALLTPGPRTIGAALRVLGRTAGNFSKYHSVFNRAHWSPLLLSRALLHLLCAHFVPPGAALWIVVDETLERRRSRQLAYRGLFRDPVRSTATQVQFSWGLRWLVFSLLVAVPWSPRRWALPFLIYPLLSEKACARLKRPHHTVTETTARLLYHFRQWVPDADVFLVGDGTYAALPLVRACQQARRPVCLISRLRLDAALYDVPGPQPKGKRGPKPQKGTRLPSLAARLTAADTEWARVRVRWYGGPEREVELATDTALWYRAGGPPVAVRWVLVRPVPEDRAPFTPGACFGTDPTLGAVEILEGFIGRWNTEVTFAEARAHLGFETQRYWSRKAAGRTTPCLLGLFSVVVVLAKGLHPEQLPVRQSAWYAKESATFGDALAAVRRALWEVRFAVPREQENNPHSPETADRELIPRELWHSLAEIACYAP